MRDIENHITVDEFYIDPENKCRRCKRTNNNCLCENEGDE